MSGPARARWLAFSVWAAACQSTETIPRTEVLLQVDVGDQIKASADQLVVELAREGEAQDAGAAHEERFTLDGDFGWPATIALLPKEGGASYGFRVQATAYAGTQRLAVARVISQFLKEKTLLLELELDNACLGKLDCHSDETCVPEHDKAMCVSAAVDAKLLKQIHTAPAKASDAGQPRDASDAHATGDAQLPPDASSADDAEPAEEGGTEDSDAGDASQADAAETGDASACGNTEDCFNGLDDDCDGHPDCADSDCDARAQCVPDQPSVGARVPSGQPCPDGYTAARMDLHRNLAGGGCGGCSCGSAAATTCSAQLIAYASSGSCIIGAPDQTASLSSFTCNQTPIFDGTLAGVAVGAISANPGSCPAQGTAQPAPAHWGEDGVLCVLERRGGGCAGSRVCAPKPSAGKLCAESASASCPGDQTPELWYTSYDDTRACDACTCTASGASCAGVTVHYGNDYSCFDSHVLGASEKYCGSVYSPPAGLVGTPVNASCTPNSALSGALRPRGDVNLCCLP